MKIKYWALIALSLFWVGFPQTSSAQTDDTYDLLTPLPLGEGGAVEDTVTTSGFGFSEFINDIIVVAIALAAGLAVVMIIIGGIKYMTSVSADGKSSGKEYVTNAVGGLLLALGSFIILNTINPELVQIRGVEQITVNVSERPEEPGWYYERFNGTWSDTFGTGVGSQQECEDARQDEEENNDIDGVSTYGCIEITGNENTFCYFYESTGEYSSNDCFNSSSRCDAAQRNENGELKDTIVVPCASYDDPNDPKVCVVYNQFGTGLDRRNCFPTASACSAAEEYIVQDRDGDRGVIVESCSVGGRGGGNSSARFCYTEIQGRAGGYGGDENNVCEPEWNDDIDLCEAVLNTARDSRPSDYTFRECYPNPNFVSDSGDGGDAPLYSHCISIEEGENERFLCAPTSEDCRGVAEDIGVSANNCYQRSYEEGESNLIRLVEPCTNCEPLSNTISASNRRMVKSSLKAKLEGTSQNPGFLPRLSSLLGGYSEFAVTEAWPPTSLHQSLCHRDGDCIDLNYRGDTRDIIEKSFVDGGATITDAASILTSTIRLAAPHGLCLVYEYDPDALNPERRSWDKHFTGIRSQIRKNGDEDVAANIKAIPDVTAPHFSVYNSATHPNCSPLNQ
ncbi:MAG: pilin [Candidatus Paceibacterota bacterium]